MPRKTLIRSKEFPYHVTARCNNKDPFFNDLNEVWRIISHELNVIIEKFECKIHAFVLMPNHFHLLISTPRDDLGVVMQNFMISITKKINSNSGRTGRVFGARYHWTLIDHDEYYDCAVKYVYRNPVKAGLCENVESYPYSTMKHVIDNYHPVFKMHPPLGHDQLIPEGNIDAFLHWQNQPFPNEQERAIRYGFQKSVFVPPKEGWQNKSTILEQFRPMNVTRPA